MTPAEVTMDMLARVKYVEPKPGHQLEITFTTGETGIYDCTPLLSFGIFRELKDEAYFRQVSVVNGTVAWAHEQDICPDRLYLESAKVAAPR